jgi:hypothetical protein
MVDNVNTVPRPVSSPERLGHSLPAIIIQHPSPEPKEPGLQKELQNGVKKPMVNGWSDHYLGEKTRVDGIEGDNEIGVQS